MSISVLRQNLSELTISGGIQTRSDKKQAKSAGFYCLSEDAIVNISGFLDPKSGVNFCRAIFNPVLLRETFNIFSKCNFGFQSKPFKNPYSTIYSVRSSIVSEQGVGVISCVGDSKRMLLSNTFHESRGAYQMLSLTLQNKNLGESAEILAAIPTVSGLRGIRDHVELKAISSLIEKSDCADVDIDYIINKKNEYFVIDPQGFENAVKSFVSKLVVQDNPVAEEKIELLLTALENQPLVMFRVILSAAVDYARRGSFEVAQDLLGRVPDGDVRLDIRLLKEFTTLAVRVIADVKGVVLDSEPLTLEIKKQFLNSVLFQNHSKNLLLVVAELLPKMPEYLNIEHSEINLISKLVDQGCYDLLNINQIIEKKDTYFLFNGHVFYKAIQKYVKDLIAIDSEESLEKLSIIIRGFLDNDDLILYAAEEFAWAGHYDRAQELIVPQTGQNSIPNRAQYLAFVEVIAQSRGDELGLDPVLDSDKSLIIQSLLNKALELDEIERAERLCSIYDPSPFRNRVLKDLVSKYLYFGVFDSALRCEKMMTEGRLKTRAIQEINSFDIQESYD